MPAIEAGQALAAVPYPGRARLPTGRAIWRTILPPARSCAPGLACPTVGQRGPGEAEESPASLAGLPGCGSIVATRTKIASGKSTGKAERARTPDKLQKLAYAAAVEELAERGIAWTDADTAMLRSALGIGSPQKESVEWIARLADPRVKEALRLALANAPEAEGKFFGNIGHAANTLLRAAEEHQEPWEETHWREVLINYAMLDVGWWTVEGTRPAIFRRGAPVGIPARDLALLSVLAGTATWERIFPLRASHPGLSGRDAISTERRAMGYYTSESKHSARLK